MKVELVDHMGNDLSPIRAAIVSNGVTNLDKYVDDDLRYTPAAHSLINFLARGCTSGDWASVADSLVNRTAEEIEEIEDVLNYVRHMPPHWTPFGHTAITVYVKAPLFVARQLGKSQVGFVWNEISRRYVDSEPEFYVPDVWRKKAENIKQGSSHVKMALDGTQKCGYCLGEMAFLREEDKKMKKFCSSKCQSNYYRKVTDSGWAKVKVSRLKQSAKRRGIKFNLTAKYLESLGRPKYCKYLEVELDYSTSTLLPNSPSVNRIDNTKGYVEGNVEIISNKANTMLSDTSKEDLKVFLKNVSFENYGIFFNSATSVSSYYEEMKNLYGKLIKGGLSAEQARMFLPQSLFSEWFWTGNLYSFSKMFVSRTDPHTQKETQEVAKMIGDLIEPLFPISWKALTT